MRTGRTPTRRREGSGAALGQPQGTCTPRGRLLGLANTGADMPREEHTKAANDHENAAKSHRTAAEHYGKGENDKGMEHSSKAHDASKTAHESSQTAHTKSQSHGKSQSGMK